MTDGMHDRPVPPTERSRAHETAARAEEQRSVTSADAPAEDSDDHLDTSATHLLASGSRTSDDVDDDVNTEEPMKDSEYRDKTPDHNRQRIEEANRRTPEAKDESSGVEGLDKLNEGARNVLGDANVDYSEAELYMEPDAAALQKAGEVHGDRIVPKPDGSHDVISVAPSPADDQADTPASRKLRHKAESED